MDKSGILNISHYPLLTKPHIWRSCIFLGDLPLYSKKRNVRKPVVVYFISLHRKRKKPNANLSISEVSSVIYTYRDSFNPKGRRKNKVRKTKTTKRFDNCYVINDNLINNDILFGLKKWLHTRILACTVVHYFSTKSSLFGRNLERT